PPSAGLRRSRARAAAQSLPAARPARLREFCASAVRTLVSEADTAPAAAARVEPPAGEAPLAAARDAAPERLPASGAFPAGWCPATRPVSVRDGRSRERAHGAGDRGNSGTLSAYGVPAPPGLVGPAPTVICQYPLRHSVQRRAPCRP